MKSNFADELQDHELQPGLFIAIPAWKTFGLIVDTKPAMYGSDSAIMVLLQEDPESDKTQWYTLDNVEFPGCYEIEE